MTIHDIFFDTHSVLLCADPVDKARASIDLYSRWQGMSSEEQAFAQSMPNATDIEVLEAPGRPDHPDLAVGYSNLGSFIMSSVN